MKNHNLYVVLGMHRSGTSITSRALKVFNISHGTELIEAVPEVNAKGFYEDKDILHFNQTMLHKLNKDWYCLAYPTENAFDNLPHSDFDNAINLIADKIKNYPALAIKDPRIPNLLPFWIKVFKKCKLNVKFILSVRHPFAVAASLQKVHGIPSDISCLMWIVSLVNSLRWSSGNISLVVDFDILLANPQNELSRLSKALNLPILKTEEIDFVNGFVDENLCHCKSSENLIPLDNDFIQQALKIYNEVRLLATDIVALGDQNFGIKLKQWSQMIDGYYPLLSLLDEKANTINALNKQIVDKDTHIRNLEAAFLDFQ